MAAIGKTRKLARVQVVDCTQEDPMVDRYAWVQTIADGTPVGPAEWVQLKSKPLSAFADLASLETIVDADFPETP